MYSPASIGAKRLLLVVMLVSLALPLLFAGAALASQPADGGSAPALAPPSPDDPTAIRPTKPPQGDSDVDNVNAREDWFYSRRTAGTTPVSVPQAAAARAKAAQDLINLKGSGNAPSKAPQALGGSWLARGPDPIVQWDRSYTFLHAVAGRIGALAVRSTAPYTMYLGAAQGGVWVSTDPTTDGWTPVTDQLGSLAIGAIALAPSNEDIVYVGTGEGALSGDSYYGNGILKSTDGGQTFAQISGVFFNQVSISKIVVDPADPNHLYVGTLRGRGGSRRVSPPSPTPFGVWESTNGGTSWTLRLKTAEQGITFGGVTDLAMDPLVPTTIYASMLGTGISKTVDGGLNWVTAMSGLPVTSNYGREPSRFALGIGHPSLAVSATLYTGFDWFDNANAYHHATIWKSTDEGANWAETNTAVVGGYCDQGPTSSTSQCFYDNVIGVDPISPTIVYVLGLWSYFPDSDGVADTNGGAFRSMDGGANWTNIGFGLHPDFHAIAIRKDAPNNVLIGNDGGVWSSANYGGRITPTATFDSVDWLDLNGDVNPVTGVVNASYGLQIAQFSSIANNPGRTTRLYGGTQDNGTLRKIGGSNGWIDYASGDGGQVIVDPIDPTFVYQTYTGLALYRFDEAMLSGNFGGTINHAIVAGITTTDRAEFYVPWTMDPDQHTRLYVGSFRVYRTDNQGNRWNLISGDLTSGCAGSAPNGARGCLISALGATAGGDFLWVGTDDGYVWVGSHTTTASPTWTRVDQAPLPNRPVTSIAVDRSNYRIAYVAYGGFNLGTPAQPGHIFKTTDAGATWTDISGTLPDVPLNSIVIDPSYPNTLYVGTDVGPMVSNNGGATWLPLGTDFPIVTVWQLDFNPVKRQLAAGSHGRGGWTLIDSTLLPALNVRKSAVDLPVGPNQLLTYTITVKNWGDAPATGISITDPVPANTTFVSASNGGTLQGGSVVWSGAGTVMSATITNAALGAVAPGVLTVTYTVQTSNSLAAGSVITNDGIVVSSNEVANISGSPMYETLAPSAAVQLTPASQTDGAFAGQTVSYTLSAKNLSFNTDTYNLSKTGNAWPTSFWDATNSTPITQTPPVGPGQTVNFVVRVTVPATVTTGMSDTVTVIATSANNPAVSANASITTLGVDVPVLLVDDDASPGTGFPNASTYYTTVMNATGIPYEVWNLKANPALPLGFMKAHKAIVWWTGAAFPAPLAAYESRLAGYLDNGGRLFMTSFDGLDGTAGNTSFVLNYLHVTWNSTADNDKSTDPMTVTGVLTNPVTSVLSGTYTVNNTAFGYCVCNDWIVPNGPALAATLDVGANQINGLTATDVSGVTSKEYRVVFLAFPPEAMGTTQDGVTLMTSVMKYFGISGSKLYLPIIRR